MFWNKTEIWYNGNMKKIEKTKAKKEDEKKQIAKNNTKNFKQKYFAFYDDVKHYTNGKEDWW